MVLVNYTTRELTAKVVYYGPGLCGKTTNLQYIFDSLPPDKKGKMISLATKTDRTLFFDFLPLDLGTIKGMRTRIQLYTVPGQVFYNETRKLVLRGADGIVFVADSNRNMMDANLESLQNLEENLKEYGIEIDDLPLVLQYNKRDLPNIYSVEELDQALKQKNQSWPSFEAVAIEGTGVHETLKAVSKLVLKHLAAKFSAGGAEKPLAGATETQQSPPVHSQPAAPRQAAPSPPPQQEVQPPAAPVAQEPAGGMEIEMPEEQEEPTIAMGSGGEDEMEMEPVPVEESVSIGGEMSDEEYAKFYGGSGIEPSGSEGGGATEADASWGDEDTIQIGDEDETFGGAEMEIGSEGEDYSQWMGTQDEEQEDTIELQDDEEAFVLDASEEPSPSIEMPAAETSAPEAPAAPAPEAPSPAGPEIRADQPIEIPIPLALSGGQGEVRRTVVVPLKFDSSSGSQTLELTLQLVLKPAGD